MVSRETKAKLQKRNREIYDLRQGEGLTIRQLAKVFELSNASIWLILKGVERETKQRKRLAVAEQAIFMGKNVEITALNLPIRIQLALEAEDITYTDELFTMGKMDFLRMRNLGPKSVQFLDELFSSYGKWSQKKWL